MTRCYEKTTPCTGEGCQPGDIAVNPFVALRVAYGMLLGEEDFRVLMGYPRGKQMVHSSWLHGSGVVWGYKVGCTDDKTLAIGPGLALDGIGRELPNSPGCCLDLYELAKQYVNEGPPNKSDIRGGCCHDDDSRRKDPGRRHKNDRGKDDEADSSSCTSWTVHVCLVASFDTCLTAAVPTLSDPCDVTRKNDDYSRAVEQTRFNLVDGCCPRPKHTYHRVRVLLGLEEVSDGDEAGEGALKARTKVIDAPLADRARELVRQFRRMAAWDTGDLRPDDQDGDCNVSAFPCDDEDSGVPLACLSFRVVERDGCRSIENVCVDETVRTALLPTSTIQELTCGLAPALLGDTDRPAAEGPQVIGPEVVLEGAGRRLVIPVTAPLIASSVHGAVSITSLSTERPGGWVVEDIYGTKFDAAKQSIVVSLADRPVNPLVRVVVRGTGPRPVMGQQPVAPLAGVVGDHPTSRYDGRDAVWTFTHESSVGDPPYQEKDDDDEEAGA
jgi:hypothetical protein